MRFLLVSIIGIALIHVSCFKKRNYSEDFNTNIYDTEYIGGKWFEYVDYVLPVEEDTLDTMIRFRFILSDDELLADNPVVSIYIEEPTLGSQSTSGYGPKSSKYEPYYFYASPDIDIAEYCFKTSVRTADTNGIVKLLHSYTDCVFYQK